MPILNKHTYTLTLASILLYSIHFLHSSLETFFSLIKMSIVKFRYYN